MNWSAFWQWATGGPGVNRRAVSARWNSELFPASIELKQERREFSFPGPSAILSIAAEARLPTESHRYSGLIFCATPEALRGCVRAHY